MNSPNRMQSSSVQDAPIPSAAAAAADGSGDDGPPLPTCPMLYAVASNDDSPAGTSSLDSLLSARHLRAKSWDVSDLSLSLIRSGGGGAAAAAAAAAANLNAMSAAATAVRVQLSGLSVAVECVLDLAIVALQGTWEVPAGLPNGQQICDCIFVLPVNYKVSVLSVEVSLDNNRMLASSVVPREEADSLLRDIGSSFAARPSTPQPSSPSSRRNGAARGAASFILRSKTVGGEREKGQQQGPAAAMGLSRGRERNASFGGVEGSSMEEKKGDGQSGADGLGESVFRSGWLVQDTGSYTPNLFRIRIPKVSAGQEVKVRVSYAEQMAVRDGYSKVSVPLVVPRDMLPRDVPLHEVVRVSCVINSGKPKPMKIGDFNHPMKVMFVELGRATFVGFPDSDDADSWPNADFVASYQVVSEDLHASVVVQAPLHPDVDPRASFCLSLCPPDTPSDLEVHPRAVMFIVDSAGGMRGKAMEDARRAVMGALRRMSSRDLIGIIAFDYELLIFSEDMEPATPDTIKRACRFVLQAFETEDPTNILSPLQLAMSMLADVRGCIPQIVLITDGSAKHEAEVVRFVEGSLSEWGNSHLPRIFTFGVGLECNFFFLRWLSAITRGITDMAYYPDEVKPRLSRLLAAIARPLISNVSFKELPAGCEVFPAFIPDLHLGLPLTVSGKMAVEGAEGEELEIPAALEMRGTLGSGETWKAKVPCSDGATLQISLVGMKEQMDLLTAEAWMSENRSLDKKVAVLSVLSSMVSESTRMIVFETNRTLLDEFHQDRFQGRKSNLRKYMEPKALWLTFAPGRTIGFGPTQEVSLDDVNSPSARLRRAKLKSCLAPQLEDEEDFPSHSTKGLFGSVISCYRPKF